MGLALTVSTGTSTLPAEGVANVVLGSGSFQIPFNIANSGSPPREVQLYIAASANTNSAANRYPSTAVSSDDASFIPQGKWRLLDRQAPNVGQFNVSASPEGTFWFATRTIDSGGRPHPPGPIEPELKVTIDTTEPAVELVAESSADGKVVAEFIVEDSTGVDQMTVHYVTDVTRQWQNATINRTKQGGRFSFDPNDQWQELSLRLRVVDRAGNERIVKKRVQKPRVANSNATRFASSPGPGNTLGNKPAATRDAAPPYGSTLVPSATAASDHRSLDEPTAAQAKLAASPFGFSSPFGYGGSGPAPVPPAPTEVANQRLNRQQVSGQPSGVQVSGGQVSGGQVSKRSLPYTAQVTAAPVGQTMQQTPYPGDGRLAGNSSALPPPSTAAQISQDFGLSPQPGLPTNSMNGSASPTVEMLPNAYPGAESLPVPSAEPDTPQSNEQTRTPELDARPQTPAEAMRPLNEPQAASTVPGASAGNFLDMDDRIQSSSEASRGPADLTPQTRFQSQPSKTEMVPAPMGQPPTPTQLNRPTLDNTSLDRNAIAPAEPNSSEPDRSYRNDETAAPSPWSPVYPNRAEGNRAEVSVDSGVPGRTLNRSETREDQRQPTLDRGRSTVTRSRLPRLSLDELAQRSVVRHSDSRQFSLDYEIEAIGGRGVEAVELFGTTDGGQTWKRWGDDPDRVSPFDIETNGEGIFGFNIVVVAANGLASPRPLPGDVPDIVVVVDETDPEVSISGARYGESDRAGSLVIQYRCKDQYLMSRPITLSFSDSPNGPWTTIAAGLRNLGDYVWPADPQLPRQIYLRIDATDQSGNVGGFVLEEPIDTRGLAPRARIRAFRSIPTN